MIYATVGTMFLDFPRLINAIDAIAHTTGEPVIVQRGMGKTIPAHCESFDFRSREGVLALQREARVIVCHAGIGCISDALHAQRPLIVVPRLKRFNEHMNDHQLELARAVEERRWGRMILQIDDLAAACANPPAAYSGYKPASAPLIGALREYIAGIAAKKTRA